ncbi:hypothetical protein HZH66_014301 [Vespula vulgaris]|uniref:Uncharacterized protein n=1 Tax=Vespula vulgaris TaxID=7454 RepID=A0A834MQ31_VESVU|nr:hypothetical protein HZH66_014301 [Vespula vulgaris]
MQSVHSAWIFTGSKTVTISARLSSAMVGQALSDEQEEETAGGKPFAQGVEVPGEDRCEGRRGRGREERGRVKEEEEEKKILLDALAVHNPSRGFTLRQNARKRACHVADGNEEGKRQIETKREKERCELNDSAWMFLMPDLESLRVREENR